MMRHCSNPALTFFKVFTKHLNWFISLLTPNSIRNFLQVNISFTYSLYLARRWTNMPSLFRINLPTTLLIRAFDFQILAWVHTRSQTIKFRMRGVPLIYHKLDHRLPDSLCNFLLFFWLLDSIVLKLFLFGSWT